MLRFCALDFADGAWYPGDGVTRFLRGPFVVLLFVDVETRKSSHQRSRHQSLAALQTSFSLCRLEPLWAYGRGLGDSSIRISRENAHHDRLAEKRASLGSALEASVFRAAYRQGEVVQNQFK